MSHSNPPIGQIIPANTTAHRDAIHVATIPLVAAPNAYLKPGEPFDIDSNGAAVSASVKDAIGVVDPFLVTSVRPGERFFGLLCPGSTTNLHHVWEHHRFPLPVVEPTVIEKTVTAPEDEEVTKIREFARRNNLTLSEVMNEAKENLNAECRGC